MDGERLTALCLQVMWSIWKARNEAVFNDRSPNPTETLIVAKAHDAEFILATSSVNSSNQGQNRVSDAQRWRPPREGYTKINSDAAFYVGNW